jgi:hypothetical protein
MDFIHRPKSKILKIKITTFRKLALLLSSGEWRGEEKNTYSVGPVRQSWPPSLSKGPNRIGVLLFSPSIHLRTEAEPASETL